jgi:hypothetical protein
MRDLYALCVSTLIFALLCPGLAAGDQVDSSAPLQPPAPEAPLAQVTALQGSQAFIEHQGQVARAKMHQPIYEGDRFFTGQNSRMRVSFDRGGWVDLDENTDPSLKTDIECLFIRLFAHGALFVSGANICLENKPNAVAQYSDVGYRILPQESAAGILRVTVIQGEVRTLQPPGVRVQAGYQLDLQNGQVLKGPYPATEQDLRDATSWTRFTESHLPGWLAGAAIGIGAAVLGTVASEHRHESHQPSPSPQPPPTGAGTQQSPVGAPQTPPTAQAAPTTQTAPTTVQRSRAAPLPAPAAPQDTVR